MLDVRTCAPFVHHLGRSVSSKICGHVIRSYSQGQASDAAKAQSLLSLIRSRGHLVACLDPLRRGDGGPWRGPLDTGSRCALAYIKLNEFSNAIY
jgi:2-oxoglutarate dehydrogenase complex dehydrogenase (E1) component-like enzyme